MEANKEQSERCVDIARCSIRDGETEKAIRFLNKALRLWANNKTAEELLHRLQQNEHMHNGFTNQDEDCSEGETFTRSRFSSSKSQPNFAKQNCSPNKSNKRADAASSSSNDNPSSKNTRNRKTTSSASPSRQKSASQPQLGVDYTQEQLDMVQRVRKCKDFYEILNVSKEFTEVDLKRQYRKLALQFHPDKNNAPGATEAFKAIGNAYAVLSDPKKRERYDMYGSASDSHSSHHHHHNNYYEYDYSRGFEADMSAEEIFNMFFGGGFPQGNVRRRHNGFQQQSAETERRNDSGFGVLLQLMPILILILLSIFSQLMVPDPAYSLSRTQKYNQERQTTELKVTYYVKPDFLKSYQNNVGQVERQVEEEYIDNLRTACFRERNRKDTLLWRAKLYGDANLYEEAQQLPTQSCVRLSNIYK